MCSYIQGRCTQLSIISPCCVPLQRAEMSSRLLGPGIGAGGLEKQEDVVARAGLRSVSGRDDGGLRSLRVA
ncbi:unnamed protein product [Periconia digitata]|uniref:Uncharacterized protein n=1 Tax=Periconia digitata TaxID=1303443 RepID=A0A9W4ULE9_9PLEO|nr:unnamed protein product [Periconia digitata]